MIHMYTVFILNLQKTANMNKSKFLLQCKYIVKENTQFLFYCPQKSGGSQVCSYLFS